MAQHHALQGQLCQLGLLCFFSSCIVLLACTMTHTCRNCGKQYIGRSVSWTGRGYCMAEEGSCRSDATTKHWRWRKKDWKRFEVDLLLVEAQKKWMKVEEEEAEGNGTWTWVPSASTAQSGGPSASTAQSWGPSASTSNSDHQLHHPSASPSASPANQEDHHLQQRNQDAVIILDAESDAEFESLQPKSKPKSLLQLHSLLSMKTKRLAKRRENPYTKPLKPLPSTSKSMSH